MRKYFNNHAHTIYSNVRLLDAINRPKDLIKKAHELGMSGIAITDHEILSAHVEALKVAEEIYKEDPDFLVALGNEIYLTDTSDNGQKYYHFILIAKDAIGHKALRELSSHSWFCSYMDRGLERVTTLKSELDEIVHKYPGHLIATTACIGGELGTNLLMRAKVLAIEDNYNADLYFTQAKVFLNYCKNLFGDDFYIECAPSSNEDQIVVNKQLKELSELFNIKMCIGTDAHYLTKEDRPVHKAYLNSKGGEREVDSFYEFTYLMNSDEVEELLSYSFDKDFIFEILDNSLEIQNKITKYSLFHKQDIPRVEVKDYPKKKWVDLKGNFFEDKYPILDSMFMSNDKYERYWVNQCTQKLHEIKKYNQEYLIRLEEEADVKRVIGEKLETNMFRYPVTLQHYIDLIWDCGSMVGAGRGSSCAALNHYLLGVTQLDPIEWDLPFFRYLNRERIELGDIDIDICPSKRPLILNKIKEERKAYFNEDVAEWAKENLGCTLVATFGTEGTKSAILTACRGYRSEDYPDGIDVDEA